ncbi:B3 domain-containing protein At4g01580 [Linum perenne]
MASLGKSSHGNETNLAEQGRGTHFFKIILESTILDNKLMIPRKFISKFGDKLLRSATLEVPSGDKWEVELVRDGEGVWFCNNGWQRFTEFYSFKYGHLLLFQYKGHSSFEVVIFDTTATEIEYPVLNDESPMVVDSTDDAAQQVSQVKRERCHDPIPEQNPSSSAAGNLNKTVKIEEQGLNCEESSKKPLCWRVVGGAGLAPEKPSFKIEMTSTKATAYNLHLPRWFTNEHKVFENEEMVKLEVGDKVWAVHMNVQNNKYVRFASGWRGFAQDNSLKPGDICAFELVKRWPNLSMKVTISRI